MENNITASTTITTEPEKPEDCLVGTLCMGNCYVPNRVILAAAGWNDCGPSTLRISYGDVSLSIG